MKLAELQKEIAKKHVRPAYLLMGSEPLLRDEALGIIRSAVLDPASADFNLDRLHGESTSPAALEDSLRVLPVMAARRLIILAEPEKMRGEASKPLTEALAREVGVCADWGGTVLVVIASKADRRSRWVKAFQDPAAAVDCKPPQAGKALLPFIEAEAERQEIVLEAGAAQVLVERLGPQLMLIRQELAKVRLFAGEGETVTRDHVLASAHDVAEKSIWDLTDAIGAGRTTEAIAQLGDLLGSGAAGPAILGALAGHFRRLARVREGQPVSVPPFIKQKLEKQAQRYSLLGLRHCLEAIHGVDLAIKGAGPLRPEVALESLVLDLAQ